MSTPRFQRRIEDFVCEHCGWEVKGSGYTNHCSKCLWSKHVDVNPGDRADPCGGMMEPMRVEGTSPDYVLVHHCIRCGAQRRNTVAEQDEKEVLIAVAKRSGAMNN